MTRYPEKTTMTPDEVEEFGRILSYLGEDCLRLAERMRALNRPTISPRNVKSGHQGLDKLKSLLSAMTDATTELARPLLPSIPLGNEAAENSVENSVSAITEHRKKTAKKEE